MCTVAGNGVIYLATMAIVNVIWRQTEMNKTLEHDYGEFTDKGRLRTERKSLSQN